RKPGRRGASVVTHGQYAEQGAHLIAGDQALQRRIDGKTLLRCRTRLQGFRTVRDIQPAQKIALSCRTEGPRACRRYQCREVDMGAEVGFARMVENTGAAMAANRLQR